MAAILMPVNNGPDTDYSIDRDEITRFLNLARPDGGDLMVLYIDAKGGAPVASTFAIPEQTEMLLAFAGRNNSKKRNIYWLPNLSGVAGKKPEKADMTTALFAWKDLDPSPGDYDSSRAAVLQMAEELAANASFVVDSGNGAQPYFRLSAPLPIASDFEAYERVNKLICDGGDSVYNCDRIMRVPGTWNWPTPTKLKKGYPSEPRLSRILSVSDATYSLTELETLVAADGAVASERQHVRLQAKGVDPETGEVDAKARFDDLLKTDRKLRDRWEGGHDGLGSDRSGSVMDISMYGMLVARRFSHDAIVGLMAQWGHGSDNGRKQGDRYWDRLRQNTVAEPKQQSEADKAVLEINRKHALVVFGGKTAILTEKAELSGPQVAGIEFWSPASFATFYKNKLVKMEFVDKKGDRQTKWEPVAKVWDSSFNRREYVGVEFAPEGTVRGYYNLWQGFSVEPIAGVGAFRAALGCKRFLSHIKYNVCQGNKTHFRYFVGWLAHMIQRPQEKPGVAVSIQGKKGTGKSKVVDTVRALLGSHAVIVSQSEHLLGRFNAHHATALFVAAEEAFWAGDKKAEGALKHMVTSESVQLEKKGFDIVEMRSLARYMFAGNAEWLFPATADERRLFALTCGENHIKDYAYFSAMDDQLYGEGNRKHVPGQASPGLRSLLTFLQKLDISKLNVRDAPETAGLQRQRASTLEPHVQFMLNCLNDRRMGPFGWSNSKQRIAKHDLYKAFTDAARATGRTHLCSEATFARFLTETFGWATKRTSSSPREWEVGPWNASRLAFQAKHKVDVDTGESDSIDSADDDLDTRDGSILSPSEEREADSLGYEAHLVGAYASADELYRDLIIRVAPGVASAAVDHFRRCEDLL